MPVDDAVSPMQGDRYPTGYIHRTDAAASGHDLAAEKLLHPGRHGGAGTRQGQAFLLFRGVQPDPVDFLYSQTDGTGTPAAYHLFHLHGQHCGDSSEGGNGRAVVSAVPDRQRVRSISPKPFDYLVTTFPDCYRCLALHAKVALLYNEDWKITVVGSQNATHNPKLERGIIHTGRDIFDFDFKMLNDEFDSGTT